MRYYCTYFDKNYLSRGLVLYESLCRHSGAFTLFVLCFDDFTYDFFTYSKLKGIRPYRLSELERYDKELLSIKNTRSIVEYYFTLSPCWPLFLLDRHTEIDIISYLDADMQFFETPEIIFDEMGAASVFIIKHNFSKKYRDNEKYGVFNVGFVGFRNDDDGKVCLKWWREKCIEWCFDVLEESRFADQKYLDEWPARFKGVRISQNPGLNVAPYNLDNYVLEKRDRSFFVDGHPLVFYHYHSLKEVMPGFFLLHFKEDDFNENPLAINGLYLPYVKHLKANEAKHGLAFVSQRYAAKPLSKEYKILLFKERHVLYANRYFGFLIYLPRQLRMAIRLKKALTKETPATKPTARLNHTKNIMQKLPYLNVGCGYKFDERWTNLDFVSTGPNVIAHNLLKGIPFANDTFDVVYHSHVLEHFQKKDGEKLVQECARVLKKNGIVRIAVPDLEAIAINYLKTMNQAAEDPSNAEKKANYDWMIIEMYDQTVRMRSGGEMLAFLQKEVLPNEAFVYQRCGSEVQKLREQFLHKNKPQGNAQLAHGTIGSQKKRILRLLNPINYLRYLKRLLPLAKNNTEIQRKIELADFREGGEIHQWMYDRYSLARLLSDNGFSDIRICNANSSGIPEFASFGLDTTPDGETRKPDSLFIEAKKQ